MATFGGRRAPNVSQYIAGLNSSPDVTPTDDFLAGDELNLFATTEFFDFDMGVSGGLSALPPASDFNSSPNAEPKRSSTGWQDPSKPDFLDIVDFQFPVLNSFPSIASGSTIPLNDAYPLPQNNSPLSPTSGTPRVGEKRKLNSISDLGGIEDGSPRGAAEEDKRRRNTAASARFRIKKKQREQALEKSSKEMTDKASKLETKVLQLEMENQWLKSLIMEKNDAKDDFQELYDKFTKERSEEARSSEQRTDGVGTTAENSDADGSES